MKKPKTTQTPEVRPSGRIYIEILNGPHAGKRHDISSFQGDPAAELQHLAKQGYQWKIDFSEATDEQAFIWGRADMVNRIARALRDGRKVVYAGQEYSFANCQTDEERMNVGGQLEDAIAEDNFGVAVEQDDEEGVVIGTHLPTDPKKQN